MRVSGLPASVREMGALVFVQDRQAQKKVTALKENLRRAGVRDRTNRAADGCQGNRPAARDGHPGLRDPVESFQQSPEVSPRLDLVPRQNSTAGTWH